MTNIQDDTDENLATSRNLLVNPTFMQRHVGGLARPEDNQKYIDNQTQLIKAGDRLLPPNLRQDKATLAQDSQVTKKRDVYMRGLDERYDPYTAFLYNKGLLNDGTTIRRFKTLYIDINSKFRNTMPTLQLSDTVQLDRDPLDFNVNSKTLFIRQNFHNFEVGDLVTIMNAIGKQAVLRTINDNGDPTFIIPGGCNFMKIFFQHGLPATYTGDTVEIELQGIKGDRGGPTLPILGNIPINLINTRHKVRVTLTQADLNAGCNISSFPADFFEFSPDYFFVILPKAMQNPSGDPYTLREYNFKLLFLDIAGVPTNLINAQYPIDSEHRQGFHIIKNIRDNGYEIELVTPALVDENGGGPFITVAKVLAIETGYPNANKYIIDIGGNYNEVVSARIVSSEFPNTERVIKDFPPERANNKIYWNDIDDGDFLYSLEIPPGNYTPEALEATLETLFHNTPRISQQTGYLPNHFVDVNINTFTDEVTFTTFKEALLTQPFVDVNPPINPTPGSDNPNAVYTVTIRHPNHQLITPGQTIRISGAIAYMGIPADVLNGEHVITSIIDENNYTIRLPKFNLLPVREDTRGGVAVTVLVPDQFRVRFDQPDTAGGLLGFRNPGDINSVTNFENVISNKDEYAFDIDKNNFGAPVKIDNNAIQLSGDNYMLMKAEPLETLFSIGPTKMAFAKILLCDSPGKVIFNSFVPTIRYYEDPVHELRQLDIELLTPDGFLYDFNGIDHSFTIEIVIVSDIPEGTGISASTGKNYNSIV